MNEEYEVEQSESELPPVERSLRHKLHTAINDRTQRVCDELGIDVDDFEMWRSVHSREDLQAILATIED